MAHRDYGRDDRGGRQGRGQDDRDDQGRGYQGRSYEGRGYEGRGAAGRGGYDGDPDRDHYGSRGDYDPGWDREGDRAYERYYGDRFYSGGRDADPNWSLDRGGRAGYSGSAGYGMGGGRQSHAGRGPKGYRRSDQRIEEDVNEALARHPDLDASDIEVSVENGEVTLSGEVEDRRAKRLAEDIAERCWGVDDVHNRIRARRGLLSSMLGGGESDRDRDRGESRNRSDRDVTPDATREGAAAASGGTTSGSTTSGAAASGTSGTSSGASSRSTAGRGRSASTT